MFYTISLQDLIDPDGCYFSYYRYNLTNQEDLEWPWGHGIPFSNPPKEPIILTLEDDEDAGEFADYVLNPIPLVTQRLKAVLDSLNLEKIEYYPVVIENTEGLDDFPIYWAMNGAHKVSAGNSKKSEGVQAFGQDGANLYKQFVPNYEGLKGQDVFIMAENLGQVVVSDRVKTAIEKAGIDTLVFNELGTYS